MTFRVYVLAAIVAAAVLPTFGQLSVSVGSDGNTINYRAGGSLSPNSSLSCTNVYIDDFPMPGSCNACPCPNLPLSTGSGICNLGGVHVVRANATGPGGISYDLGQQIIAVGPPPASCGFSGGLIQFEITGNTSSNDRRVLLSNTHVGAGGTPVYPYPHYQNLLAQDGVIPVNFRTIVDGVETSGIPVTVKVLDPADPSPYVAGPAPPATPPQPVPGPGSAYSRPGDNAGDPATLVGTALTDNGNGTYSAVSGENGFVGVELHLPVRPPSTATNPNPTYNPAHPGDNYQVEVTATFPDGSTKTVRSGVITVWKRMFVEKKQMFRRGIELATNAPSGVKHITIPNRHLTPGGASSDDINRNDHIMLLHAPPYGQVKSPSAYYRVIYQVTASPKVVTATAPTAGTGTLTPDSASTTIVGVGTRFTRQLKVESVINIQYPSGSTDWRVVLAIPDNTHVRVNAPPSATATGIPYTIGDSKLTAGVAYVQLTLDRALGEDYQIEPATRPRSSPNVPPTPVPALNDGVAKLAGAALAATDLFNVDDSALIGTTPANTFPSVYTEYIVLPPPSPSAPLPHVLLPNRSPIAQFFVNKWFDLPSPTLGQGGDPTVLDDYFCFVPSNHQLLLVGDSAQADHDTGQTFRVGQALGQRCSILDRGEVERDTADNTHSLYGLNVDNVMRRVEMHEFAHQFDVNPTTTGFHCQEVGYLSTQSYPSTSPPAAPPVGTQFCLMAVDSTLQMPAPWNPSLLIFTTVRAYGDADKTFHMSQGANATWDSEYFTIRKAADPWRP